MDFKEKYNEYLKEVNDYLEKVMTFPDCPEENLFDAMKYSLFAGGKRLRPVLMLASADMLGLEHKEVLPFAAALEMIHTYSLIHDDLPAMDNDDYRRGKPTSHKVYGEAKAILAGDGLLTYAFTVCSESKNPNALKAVNLLSKAAGINGMIAGQIVDIESEDKKIDLELLKYMHRTKTGALIKVAAEIPAVLANANETEYNSLMKYTESIGIAFQIKDDILDREGSFKELGKPIGSDEDLNKSTYVTLLGLEESKKLLKEEIKDSLAAISINYKNIDFLKALAKYIAERKY
jgi:geranylgeranyl diphosphate synthase type II